MSKPRDNQRSKMYKAEREAFNKCFSNEKYEGKDSLVRCQQVIDKLVKNSNWFKKHWGEVVDVEARPGKGHTRATAHRFRDYVCGIKYYKGIIQLPKWSRQTWVILHELSHVITSNRCAAHGWEFARNYLQLVRHVMGKDAEKKLKESFKKHRVKYNPPRKISKERKEQLREHMLQVRLAACKNNSKD